MSDLKYQSLAQLEISRRNCDKYINSLKSKLAGQQERLKWIDNYIYQNTPKELTIKEIEKVLGHKVIIKQ